MNILLLKNNLNFAKPIIELYTNEIITNWNKMLAKKTMNKSEYLEVPKLIDTLYAWSIKSK